MIRFTRACRLLAAGALALSLQACATLPPVHHPITLTIAHVNDTHSALEATEERLLIDGIPTKAYLGGFSRLKTALDSLRADSKHLLLLHAGDAVQGTLYFTRFEGAADIAFLNTIGVDAMTLGNHEFDRGPELTGRLVDQARFPIVSANLDVSKEPALAGKVKPYVIREVEGEKVAIVGVTTTYTPAAVASVGKVRFLDEAASVGATVKRLRAEGVERIVVLSHIGYENDLQLARTVGGIDVIVGGHTHSLLGDAAALGKLGLTPSGPYPTVVKGPEGKEVLVVQAWKWGEELGALTVRFDAGGDVAGYEARPQLLVGDTFSRDEAVVPPGSADYRAIIAAVNGSTVARIVPEDPAVLGQLAPYSREIQRYKNTAIGAVAVDDLIRGPNSGPGPLMADAMLAKVPTARIAFLGSGGVRRDILKGEITLAAVLGSFPFGNTLVTLDLTGAEVKNALEEGIDFQIAMHPPDSGDWQKLPIIHTAGLSYRVNPLRPKGERVSDLRLKSAGSSVTPIDPAATYHVVTDSFLAGGHDGMTTFGKTTGNRIDTGFLGSDVFIDYLRHLGRVTPPSEQRVVIEPSRNDRPEPRTWLRDILRRAAPSSARLQPAITAFG